MDPLHAAADALRPDQALSVGTSGLYRGAIDHEAVQGSLHCSLRAGVQGSLHDKKGSLR